MKTVLAGLAMLAAARAFGPRRPRLGERERLRKPLCSSFRGRGGVHRSSGEITNRIRSVLGLTDTIPPDFEGTFNVDGHRVVIYKSRGAPGGGLIRTYIELNGRLVPVGRLAQACGLMLRRR